MILIFTKKFNKNRTKLFWNNKIINDKIAQVIIEFSEDKFNAKCYRKALKNIWKNIHELQVWWDIRILIQLIIEKDKCYFLNFGTHSSLELTWNKRVKL